MQFDLGRRADYAIRCTLDLALTYGRGPRKAREIADEMAVPRSYVPGIMRTLVDAGLVTSTAGPRGGYALTRPPAAVTLLTVIEASDGPQPPATCVLRGGPCRWDGRCAVHESWSGAQQAMRDHLAATTFADLAAADGALRT